MASTGVDRIENLDPYVAFKAPVKTITTANITLSGAQTINGVSIVADDRVLVNSQTDATENGIYKASATAWVRADDFNGTRDAAEGTIVFVQQGTTYPDTFWRLTTTGAITFGTSSISFGIFGNFSATSPIIHATTATMVADTELAAGQYVQTIEHTTGYGYEGGNLYLIYAASQGTDDNGAFLDLDNGAFAKALFPNGKNILQWGCVGDASTDNSTPLQNAVNYLETDGGVLGAPEGTFNFSTKINFDIHSSGGIHLKGRGMGNIQTSDISGFAEAPTIFRYTGTDIAFEVLRSTGGTVTSSVEFSDFQLRMPNATTSTGGAATGNTTGIWVQTAHSGSAIRRVHIIGASTSHTAPLNYTGLGVYVGQNSQFFTIQDSAIQYVDTAIYSYGFNDFLRINNTKTHRLQSRGLVLGDTASANVAGVTTLIENCSFSQVVDGYLIFMRDPLNVHITNNHFESDAGVATNNNAQIVVGTNTKAGDAQTDEADGVYISNNWTNGNNQANAFVELRRASNVVVSNNTHRDFLVALVQNGDSSMTVSDVEMLTVLDNTRRNGSYPDVDTTSNAVDVLFHHRNGTGNRSYDIQGVSASNDMVRMGILGEAQYRLKIQADGLMEWSNGTDAADVNLYRRATNDLKTDHTFIATQGLGVGNAIAATTAGTVTYRVPVVDANGSALGEMLLYSGSS